MKSCLLCSSFGSTSKFCDNLWVGGSLELNADFDIVFFFRDLKYSSLSSVYSCTWIYAGWGSSRSTSISLLLSGKFSAINCVDCLKLFLKQFWFWTCSKIAFCDLDLLCCSKGTKRVAMGGTNSRKAVGFLLAVFRENFFWLFLWIDARRNGCQNGMTFGLIFPYSLRELLIFSMRCRSFI